MLCCALTVANAQQPAADKADPPKPGSIKGRVVGDDGQPLAGIPVTLFTFGRNAARRPGPAAAPSQTTTDDEGNFEFADLQPAAYGISASVPGYVVPPPEKEEGEETGRNIYHVGDIANMTLVKGGVITGKVINSNGEPLTGVGVNAIRIANLNGEPDELSAVRGFGRNWRTDDRGIYRIYGLIPGTYIVQTGQIGGRNLGPPSQFSEDAPTYYPSSARDAAVHLPVRAGDEVAGIDIRYRGDKGHSVGGKVLTKPGDDVAGFNASQIILRLAGTDTVVATTAQAGRGANSGFVFYGIPDGDYEITARRNGATAAEPNSASAPRRVAVRGADVSGIQIALTPLALLSGKVVIEKNAASASCQIPRRSFVEEVLMTALKDEPAASDASAETRSNTSRAAADSTGEFSMRSLEPGRWRLLPQLPDENWFVRAINAPAAPTAPAARRPAAAAAPAPYNLARNGVALKSGDKVAGITISVAEGAAAVKGNLTTAEGGKPSRKMRVHLIPAEKESADDVLRYAQTSAAADGGFHLKNLAPGRYFLLARPIKIEEPAGAPARPAAWDNLQRAALRKEAEAAGNVLELSPCQRINDHKLNVPN